MVAVDSLLTLHSAWTLGEVLALQQLIYIVL